MKSGSLIVTALAVALVASGCAQKSDIEAVQSTQKEILAKLEKIEKDIAARPAAPGARPQVDPNKVYDIPVGNSHVRGPKAAPVTITMFSDFQCPFCAQATPIVDEVLKAYPNDVNFVMKQFPLAMHPGADPAARAALAAGKQGKFWEMHDELYKNGKGLSDPQTIKGIAEKLALDMKKFDADMSSDEIKQQVAAELALGQKSDVRGTPSFFVNGKIAQNRSVEGFKAQVEEELKKKKG